MENENKKLYGTVLIKAARILDALAKKGGQTIKEISEETAITPSTVSKILETLSYIGYVNKESQRKSYYLGAKFLEYSGKNIGVQRLVAVAQPILEVLRDTLNETIHLSILENDKVIYVLKLEPKNRSVYMSSKVGMKRPLYSSGMGKAILSTFSEEELNNYLAKTELTSFTRHTITQKKHLVDELQSIQKLGYAVDDEEQEEDCYCIAMALFQKEHLAGAVSVSCPKFRVTQELKKEIIEKLQEAKTTIETELTF